MPERDNFIVTEIAASEAKRLSPRIDRFHNIDSQSLVFAKEQYFRIVVETKTLIYFLNLIYHSAKKKKKKEFSVIICIFIRSCFIHAKVIYYYFQIVVYKISSKKQLNKHFYSIISCLF